ncbi:MAG: peptide deformylase [Roseomonas sp.]|nr:peptide deformylase [Roseomonas sp.]MCA3329249.1 peptide deformylase [Roseomonas sp.]MCA3336837.1 peptide deformylase [Roseomonas sp.]MCA3348029.1 peptide deformylase [Roseomonas sp.]MCA3365676.1 peptide deformylase [Roseomonas sp.]
MAILKIARLGHPVLLQRAEAVADPSAPEMRRLVSDMVETLEDIGGLGLAAPQVHVSLRLFIWRTAAGGHSALFNAEIAPIGDETEDAWEGCLSIPGLRGAVRRPARIRFRGQDIAGTWIEGEAAGMAARVMQHEYDHLEGVLYPMRMTDLSRLGFIEELARFNPPKPVENEGQKP